MSVDPCRNADAVAGRPRSRTLPATIARTGRQVRLHLATKAPWVDLVNEGVRRLRALAVPG